MRNRRAGWGLLLTALVAGLGWWFWRSDEPAIPLPTDVAATEFLSRVEMRDAGRELLHSGAQIALTAGEALQLQLDCEVAVSPAQQLAGTTVLPPEQWSFQLLKIPRAATAGPPGPVFSPLTLIQRTAAGKPDLSQGQSMLNGRAYPSPQGPDKMLPGWLYLQGPRYITTQPEHFDVEVRLYPAEKPRTAGQGGEPFWQTPRGPSVLLFRAEVVVAPDVTRPDG